MFVQICSIILAIYVCGVPARIVSVYLVYGGTDAKTKNAFDSERDRYVHDMVCESEPPVIVRMILTDEDYQPLLAKAVETDFFNLPGDSQFDDKGLPGCMKTPCTRWWLRIRTSERENAVSWDDCQCELGQYGHRAMQVANVLLSAIRAKEEFKKLPKPKCFYY